MKKKNWENYPFILYQTPYLKISDTRHINLYTDTRNDVQKHIHKIAQKPNTNNDTKHKCGKPAHKTY